MFHAEYLMYFVSVKLNIVRWNNLLRYIMKHYLEKVRKEKEKRVVGLLDEDLKEMGVTTLKNAPEKSGMLKVL